MTMSVRFVLSYDLEKRILSAYKVDTFSMKINVLVTDGVNDVTISHKSVDTRVVITFAITTLSTGKQ